MSEQQADQLILEEVKDMEQNGISIVPIDEKFEFYQLGRTIKIVHYKPGNLFSVTSILVSCQSEKDEEDWLSCLSLESVRDITDNDSSFIEQQIDNGPFPGWYVSQAFVPIVANWGNPIKAIYIYKLFADIELMKDKEILRWNRKFKEQKDYFYLISYAVNQTLEGFTVFDIARPKLFEHEEDRYSDNFKRRFFEVRPVEDPKMMNRKFLNKLKRIKNLVVLDFSKKMTEKERQIAKAKSRDFEFDFKYDSKNLEITMKTIFVPKFKEWLKDFFRSEFYTDDNFIE